MALPDNLRITLDVTAVTATIGALLGLLPAIAAAMSIVWLGWQMYDRIKYGPRHK